MSDKYNVIRIHMQQIISYPVAEMQLFLLLFGCVFKYRKCLIH